MANDDILPKAAIVQRNLETYAVTARLLGGVMNVPTARKIIAAAEKFDVKTIKLTGDQRLGLIGIKKEDIDAVYEAMDMRPKTGMALCQQFVKVCPGNTFCSRGLQDTLAFAEKYEEKFFPFPKILSKVKIGISGCMNSCTEPAIKDIGLVGLPKGWTLMVGGSGGQEPRIAQTIARNLDENTLFGILDKLLKYYRAASQHHQTRNMRLGEIIRIKGMDMVKKVCRLS